MKSLLTTIIGVVAVVSIIANVFLYYRYSTSRPLVTVGSDVITKKQYQDAVDYTAGSQVLKELVFTSIVSQAAMKAHVMPSKTEIDNRIKDLIRSNPSLVPDTEDTIKYAQFQQKVASEIELENLRMQGVTATEPEIAQYYNTHKQEFALPPQVSSTMVISETADKSKTAEDYLRQGLTPDVIARHGYRVVGVGGIKIDETKLAPKQRKLLENVILTTPKDGIKTVLIDNNYVTVKINSSQPFRVPSLSEIHDTAARLIRLEKGPSTPLILAKLFKEAKPQFSSDKYRAFFKDVEAAASR